MHNNNGGSGEDNTNNITLSVHPQNRVRLSRLVRNLNAVTVIDVITTLSPLTGGTYRWLQQVWRWRRNTTAAPLRRQCSSSSAPPRPRCHRCGPHVRRVWSGRLCRAAAASSPSIRAALASQTLPGTIRVGKPGCGQRPVRRELEWATRMRRCGPFAGRASTTALAPHTDEQGRCRPFQAAHRIKIATALDNTATA